MNLMPEREGKDSKERVRESEKPEICTRSSMPNNGRFFCVTLIAVGMVLPWFSFCRVKINGMVQLGGVIKMYIKELHSIGGKTKVSNGSPLKNPKIIQIIFHTSS